LSADFGFGNYSDKRGKCPRCLTSVEFLPAHINYGGNQNEGKFFVTMAKTEAIYFEFWECPACGKLTVKMRVTDKTEKVGVLGPVQVVYPLSSERLPVPLDVPKNIGQMYHQAALVLPFSEEASAALSRRCLQQVLVDAGKSTKRDLVNQTEEVLPNLPKYLSTQVDAIRNIGNFAAHPSKSNVTGEIVQVEQGEAEWNPDVLDALFDFYYVQPAKIEQKRKALDKKLSEIGKPPMKQP